MGKIKFKKRGFTLVELLAVMAILAVILVIAIPNVMNSITTSYEKTYEYNLKALKSAAKDYVIDNGIRVDNTEQKIINISKIVEDGYIKEVKDPETKEDCEGFVTVTKDDHNYKYDSYLKCGDNYKSPNYDSLNVFLPTIAILGDNPINIYLGEAYIDSGATARDYYDNDITSGITVTSNVNTSMPGTYTVTYTAVDDNGNEKTATRTVNVIDNVAPIVTFGMNGNSTYAKNRSTKVTVSDVSGVDASSLEYQWTTNTSAPLESSFTTVFTNAGTLSTPAGVTGGYYLWIFAKDNVGNTIITGTNVFNLDNTKPVITLNGSSPVTINVGGTYTDAGATATDANSGISGSVIATGTVNPSVVGTYTITYNVSDNAGNAATSVTRTINVVDTTAPTIAFGTNGSSTYAKSRSTTVTISDNVSINTSSLKYLWNTSTTAPSEASFSTTFTNGGTISTPSSVTGGYYLWILAKDTSSNTTITRTNVFNLDNTKPVITLTGSSSVTINKGSTYTDAGATATDANSGISGSVTATGTVNPNVVGTYTITYNISDNAGNAATAVTRTVNVIDVLAPVITLNGSNPTNVNVGSTYTDAGATAIDDVDGDVTSKIVVTGSVNPSVPGAYTITYTVKDNANNTATATRTVNVIDNVAPTIAFGINGNSTYAKSRSTTVTVSDAHTGVNGSSLKYQWTTSTTTPSEASFSTAFTSGGTITSPAGVTGSYYLWILAKDNAGNTTITRTNVFNLDNTKPVITIAGSNPVTINAGSTYADAGATATDANSGISGSVTATGTVNPSALGTYTITYNVSDNAGNAATAVTRTVNVVDTIAPSISTALAGTMMYTNPTFASGVNSTSVYNNTGNGNVTITRVAISGAPTSSGYGLEIKSIGTASPGWGGFKFAHSTSASKVYITRIVAKIPVGYSINWASNAIGGGPSSWLTSTAGTGDWEEYIYQVNVGTDGNYSTTDYFYLSGGTTPTSSNPLIWYVAYATVFDTTKWGTSNSAILTATDAGSGIVGYGINQSSSTAPTYTNISSSKEIGKAIDNITATGTYYVWVKDASGNTSNKSLTVSYIDRSGPTISTALAGTMLYTDPTFASGANSMQIYNNSGGGTVALSRISMSSPTGSGYVMQVTTNGTASPGIGGFVQSTLSRTNGVFIHKIIAKIPAGYTIQRASNAIGTGSSIEWLTSQAGTGDWEEYIYITRAGSSGTFSTFGHVYLNGPAGTSATPVTWYVAYATMFDATKWGTSNSLIFASSDTGAGIVGYGLNQSSSTAPTFTSVTNTSSLSTSIDNITSNGTYYVWTKDALGNTSNKSFVVSYADSSTPTYTSYTITNITSSGYDVYVYGVSDTLSGINRVQFPAWTEANGQDDLIVDWPTNSSLTGTNQGSGTWYYRVNSSSHGSASGIYDTSIFIYDNAGNASYFTASQTNVPSAVVMCAAGVANCHAMNKYSSCSCTSQFCSGVCCDTSYKYYYVANTNWNITSVKSECEASCDIDCVAFNYYTVSTSSCNDIGTCYYSCNLYTNYYYCPGYLQ